MMTSIVLLKVEPRKINEIAEALADMDGISEVYSVGGRFDLVAVVRVQKNEDLAELVTNQMVQLEGIRETESMVAYRAYSRHDLDCLFSVGLDCRGSMFRGGLGVLRREGHSDSQGVSYASEPGPAW